MTQPQKFCFAFIWLLYLTNAHMKLTYPAARSTSTGIKNGPCGSNTFDDGNTYDVTELQPNSVVTISITESAHHLGAPYRVALSHVMDDIYEDCILLNHIPQHTESGSATLYVNITIPNVDCSLCALQVLSIMTDKISDNTCCKYESDGTSGSCFSNYHSCANIVIQGTQNRNELQCNQPDNWPYRYHSRSMYTQEASSIYWNLISNNPLELELITDGGGSYESDECATTPPTTMLPTNSPIPTTPVPSRSPITAIPTESPITTSEMETETTTNVINPSKSTIYTTFYVIFIHLIAVSFI